MRPTVDINLFVHNGQATVAAAIDSVLAQSWTDWRMTLIDDGSADGTAAILADYAARFKHIHVKRNRCNTGAIGAFQRGFWIGNADFVMPKSSDDLIAPDFIKEIMAVHAANPNCAMVHAGALSYVGKGEVQFQYPAIHRLNAIENDPVARACNVMARYTSAPSFWGIYRREAVDSLAPIAHRSGWDHVLLAELALYGEIRHVPELLYWRRGTGRPVLDLARASTHEAIRGLAIDEEISDPLWRTPCITAAYAHIENFCLAREKPAQRQVLISQVVTIFGRRWGAAMQRELADARLHVARITTRICDQPTVIRVMAHLRLTQLLTAVTLLLPDADLSAERYSLALMLPETMLCLT